MSDYPQSQIPPLFISAFSAPNSAVWDLAQIVQGVTSGAVTWVANLAIYMPISLPYPYPVRRLFWVNGSTVASAHCDVGIYTQGGKQIVSAGSTVQSGASLVQYVTPASDLLLSPGRYYLGFVCDSTTSHVTGVTTWTAPNLRIAGLLQQATALPLPATMTPAAVTNALVPLCGFTRTAVGF